MTDKRKAKIAELKEKQAAHRAAHPEKFKHLKKEEGEGATPAPKKDKRKYGISIVLIDIALAIFCFATVLLFPLGFIFIATAVLKYYRYVSKTPLTRKQPKEPEQ